MEFVINLTFTEILTLVTVVIVPSIFKVIAYTNLLKKLESNDELTQKSVKLVVENLAIAVNSFTQEIGKVKTEVYTWAHKYDDLYTNHETRLLHVEKKCVIKKKGTK